MKPTHPPTTTHNYLLKAFAFVRPGEALHVHVEHDDWCDFHADGFCNCNPVVTPRTLANPVRDN